MGPAVRLGRVWGIEVGLHYSWFIVFVLVTWSLAIYHHPLAHGGWTPATHWGMGIATSALLFDSVLARELAHSLVSRAQGTPVRGITLFVFGGVSQIGQESWRAGDKLLMALVGP